MMKKDNDIYVVIIVLLVLLFLFSFGWGYGHMGGMMFFSPNLYLYVADISVNNFVSKITI